MNYLKKAQNLFTEPTWEDVHNDDRMQEDRDVFRQLLLEEMKSDPEVMSDYIAYQAPQGFIEEMLSDILDIYEEMNM